MSVDIQVAWAMAGPKGSIIRSEMTARGSMPGEYAVWQEGSVWRASYAPDGTSTTLLDHNFPRGSTHAREAWNSMYIALQRGDLTNTPATGGAPIDRARMGVMELAISMRIGNQAPLIWRYDLRDAWPPESVMQVFRATRAFHSYMRHAPGNDGKDAPPTSPPQAPHGMRIAPAPAIAQVLAAR